MNLRDEIATPEGKRRYVRSLFATIADRYDFITIALSYGQDRRWKRRLIGLVGPPRGLRVLDLATGTGDIAFALAERGAEVVGLDVTHRMIELAYAKRDGRSPARFLVGDMLALPFPSRSFDAVTVGYGLRNVPDLAVAIDEIARVVKPGGRLLSLDFNRPANGAVRWSYLAYLTVVGGALGWILHRDPDTYRYIPETLKLYPGQRGVRELMQGMGFIETGFREFAGGIMAVNFGTKP